ncbi:hypothetical protein [Nodularia sphaerocarpa]|uniref:hypothetical protein n=1 Tax=Nodularia sphaerocarpa TaxID=137816 RepID=UPI001EFB93F8|nr:hypothetical protein [Nodularia sphaerocarpa]MDB9372848.1 hypothetical protein [Nodularia sphaerocarpa CS-585]MDB9377441.1 hypothetical protein [Nodularia sphaerocarpa CS-585A2]ULP73569.1 hypothetical protein BDGGKGIB_03226 [Nodularia sphaerocarpa UHCC 0038]
MKTGLKRIEATLHDLGNRSTTPTEAGDSLKSSFSFRISVGTTESTVSADTSSAKQTEEVGGESPNDDSGEQHLFPQHQSVQTFPAQEIDGKTPSLPKFKNPSFSSHRHGANPALAMNILQEIQSHIAGWQTQLQTILQQIQDVYLEGPIVNGWLESNLQEPEQKGTATLRHGEVEQLMNYVEEICTTSGKVSEQSARSGYSLCGLDESGKVWSRPCPSEQLPMVSMAIARHQKLRQLLGRKQYLETRLSQLAETLVVLHSNIQQV